MTIDIKALDSLLSSIAKDVYVKSLKIELLGTIDDTSHEVTYIRYKKSGVLKVKDSTIDVDCLIPSGVVFHHITGTELSIKNPEIFDFVVYSFLEDCKETYKLFCPPEYHTCFVVKVKLSNGQKYNFLTDTQELFSKTESFYNLLINYQYSGYIVNRKGTYYDR